METSDKVQLGIGLTIMAISVCMIVWARKQVNKGMEDMSANRKLKEAEVRVDVARATHQYAEESFAKAAELVEKTKAEREALAAERKDFDNAVETIKPVIESINNISKASTGILPDEECAAAVAGLIPELFQACEAFQANTNSRNKIDALLKPIDLELKQEPEHEVA